jgi:hypothetical protein
VKILIIILFLFFIKFGFSQSNTDSFNNEEFSFRINSFNNSLFWIPDNKYESVMKKLINEYQWNDANIKRNNNYVDSFTSSSLGANLELSFGNNGNKTYHKINFGGAILNELININLSTNKIRKDTIIENNITYYKEVFDTNYHKAYYTRNSFNFGYHFIFQKDFSNRLYVRYGLGLQYFWGQKTFSSYIQIDKSSTEALVDTQGKVIELLGTSYSDETIDYGQDATHSFVFQIPISVNYTIINRTKKTFNKLGAFIEFSPSFGHHILKEEYDKSTIGYNTIGYITSGGLRFSFN